MEISILAQYVSARSLLTAFNAKMDTTWTPRHLFVNLALIQVVLSVVPKTNATYVNQEHLLIVMIYQQTESTQLFHVNKVVNQVIFPTRLHSVI